MAEAKKETKKGKSLLQPILIGLLVIAAFASGSMWTELKMLKGGTGLVGTTQQAGQGAAGSEAAPEEITELTDEQWQEVLAKPAAVKGDEGAEVIMVEFTDYQCPFCKRHFDQTAAQIDQEYTATGKVRYVIRDLPLSFHQNAHAAAEAARCAGDQEAYFEYHDKLFETQTAWAELADPNETFSGYAGELGLNRSTFSSCLTDGKYKAQVDEDLGLAQKVGANGTPTFFINGKALVGAQPFAAFKAMLDAELN